MLPVGLKAYWSSMLSCGIEGRNHRFTMSLSAIRESIGVTEIGLKSNSEIGLGHLEMGVTVAVRQFEGTVPDLIEIFKICATISAISNEQERNNQTGILSIPVGVCLRVRSKFIPHKVQ